MINPHPAANVLILAKLRALYEHVGLPFTELDWIRGLALLIDAARSSIKVTIE